MRNTGRLALRVALVVMTWALPRAANADVDDLKRRYDSIAQEARLVWKKAQLQDPTMREQTRSLHLEALNLAKRTADLGAEVEVFFSGYLQSQLDSGSAFITPDEGLNLLGNRIATLVAWLKLLDAHFFFRRPVYFQAATEAHQAWELLEEPR